MALPMGKTPDELRVLNDDELFDYFTDFARYIEDAPQLKYGIRFGSRTLVSADTHELWDKFRNKVRETEKEQENG